MHTHTRIHTHSHKHWPGSLIKSTNNLRKPAPPSSRQRLGAFFSPFVEECLGELGLLVNVNNLPLPLSWWNLNCSSVARLAAIHQRPPWPEKDALQVVGREEGGWGALALWNNKKVHGQLEANTHARSTHTHACRLMTTLCQLNECLLFSSDAAGHLLSLDIDLYFNCANTTENNQSITGWGHVSPRTCGALLAYPFILAQGIHYTLRLINVKISSMHIWG